MNPPLNKKKNPRINSVLKNSLYCVRLKDTAQQKNFYVDFELNKTRE